MKALGLEYLGSEHPNGRRADPTPEHLPQDTCNVVTHRPGNSPETARLQLDHSRRRPAAYGSVQAPVRASGRSMR